MGKHTDFQEELDLFLSNRSFLTDTIKNIIMTSVAMDMGIPKDTFEVSAQLEHIMNLSKVLKTTRATLEECFYPTIQFFNDNCFQLACNDYAAYQVKEFLPLCKNSLYAVHSLKKSMAANCKAKTPIGEIH